MMGYQHGMEAGMASGERQSIAPLLDIGGHTQVIDMGNNLDIFDHLLQVICQHSRISLAEINSSHELQVWPVRF